MEVTRKAHWRLSPEVNKLLGRFNHKWVDNIKTDIKYFV